MPVEDYKRIGRFIYGFQRIGFTDDELSGIGLPEAKAARATALAKKYIQIMGSLETVSDAEIEETLREAAAVRALIDQ